MLKTLQGRASAWLLSRPSNQKINQASLGAALGLLLVLVVFFATIGVLQWILTNEIQKNQADRAHLILADTSAALEMTQQIGDSHRSTLAFLLSRDVTESQDSLERRNKALESYSQILAKVESPPNSSLAVQKNNSAQLAADYEKSSARLIEMVRTGQMDEALDYRLQTLRPLFESWQAAHENLAISLAEQSNARNTDAENFARDLRLALLALIILPVLLLAIACLSFATLLGWEKLRPKSQTTPDLWSH